MEYNESDCLLEAGSATKVLVIEALQQECFNFYEGNNQNSVTQRDD